MPRHESEPRSRAQADLGGGINTLYQNGYVPKPNPEVPEKERQARATRGGILEPTAENLATIPPEAKRELAENLRKIREALAANTLSELAFSDNPVELQAVPEPIFEQLTLLED